ncbi:MAG: hypothetical protein Q9M30_06360 [Mariprofundaceae bacterium]|nr:hypothetical protein [Mariprofundaceae bacterium]
MSEDAEKTVPNNASADDGPMPVSEARRRLLKIGAYVPPAIVGMAVIGSISGTAHASGHGHGGAVGSCMPSACQPCVDFDHEDGKDDDKNGHHGKHERDKKRCEVEKEKKKRRDKKNKHNNKSSGNSGHGSSNSSKKTNQSSGPSSSGGGSQGGQSIWPFF